MCMCVFISVDYTRHTDACMTALELTKMKFESMYYIATVFHSAARATTTKKKDESPCDCIVVTVIICRLQISSYTHFKALRYCSGCR